MLRNLLKLVVLALLACPVLAKKGTLPGGPGYRLLFSKNGNRILCQRGQEIWVFNLQPRHLDLHLSNIPPEAWAALNPDGASMAVREPQGTLTVFHNTSAKEAWEYSAAETSVSRTMSPGFVFNPSGTQLLYLNSDHGILFETRTGRKVRDWSWRESTNALNAFSPDGKVLFHCEVGSLQVLSVATGELLLEFPVSGVPAMVSFRNNCASALYGGGELKVSYPGLKRQTPSFPPPQVRPDGLLRWRRTPVKFEVLYRDKIVYQGPPDHRVAWWNEGGGFPVSSSKTHKQIGVYADNGTRIPGATELFINVQGSHLSFTNSPKQITGHDMRSGKRVGTIQALTNPSPSPNGGKLAVATDKGIIIVDLNRSVHTGRLVVLGDPL
jgi:hypothetical protein